MGPTSCRRRTHCDRGGPSRPERRWPSQRAFVPFFCSASDPLPRRAPANESVWCSTFSLRLSRMSSLGVISRTSVMQYKGEKQKPLLRRWLAEGTASEHPGEVVTREELRSRLWPADTFAT